MVKIKQPYLVQSSGNINHVLVVMKERLGFVIRQKQNKLLGIYTRDYGYEPNFKFFHVSPKQFTGFTRHSRNVIYFQRDMNKFSVYENLYSKPQLFF